MAPVTAAKEQTASAPTSLLPETRVWALRPKGEARTGPTAWVSSTARWGYEHFYDGTVVGSLVGLDYAVNRYYSSGLGRFTTPDPYRASGGPADPGSWNRYSYARSDPANRRDSLGLCDQSGDDDYSVTVCGGDGSGSGGAGGGAGGGGEQGMQTVNTGDQGGGGATSDSGVLLTSDDLSALSNGYTAVAKIWERTNWSSDCQKDLSKLGVSTEQLRAAAMAVHLDIGTKTQVLQRSLYKGEATQAGNNIDPALTVSQFFAKNLATNAEADLLGNRVFLRPEFFNYAGNLYLEATIAHELLHNITGKVDDVIQRALGLSTSLSSNNITVHLLADCFSQ